MSDPVLEGLASEVAEIVEECEDFEQMFQSKGKFAVDHFQSLADHVQAFKGFLGRLANLLRSQNYQIYFAAEDIRLTVKKCVNFIVKHPVWADHVALMLRYHLRSARTEANVLVCEIGKHEKTIHRYMEIVEKLVQATHATLSSIC
jgi:hypothetical protein